MSHAAQQILPVLDVLVVRWGDALQHATEQLGDHSWQSTADRATVLQSLRGGVTAIPITPASARFSHRPGQQRWRSRRA
jgi:hypothetical protein